MKTRLYDAWTSPPPLLASYVAQKATKTGDGGRNKPCRSRDHSPDEHPWSTKRSTASRRLSELFTLDMAGPSIEPSYFPRLASSLRCLAWPLHVPTLASVTTSVKRHCSVLPGFFLDQGDLARFLPLCSLADVFVGVPFTGVFCVLADARVLCILVMILSS